MLRRKPKKEAGGGGVRSSSSVDSENMKMAYEAGARVGASE